MSNTFSPRTDGTVGKVAVRSQAHAAHLTIPLMLDAGSDIQDNNPTGPEHTEGGDSPAQAPARHRSVVEVACEGRPRARSLVSFRPLSVCSGFGSAAW